MVGKSQKCKAGANRGALSHLCPGEGQAETSAGVQTDATNGKAASLPVWRNYTHANTPQFSPPASPNLQDQGPPSSSSPPQTLHNLGNGSVSFVNATCGGFLRTVGGGGFLFRRGLTAPDRNEVDAVSGGCQEV